MKNKADFETWYSKEDPWRYVNTIPDRVRRAILLKQIEVIFSDGSKKIVLDAGCGEGYITRDVASRYTADIDAFDLSENALAIACRKNSHENIRYFQLDLNEYRPDKKYDLIMCEETLYYLADDERISAVRKFHDAINAGGYLKIASITVGEQGPRKYFTIDSIQEFLMGNGFQIVSILPSVIRKKGYVEKITYRLLENMNKLGLFHQNLLEHLVKLTLRRSLDRCHAISLLAKKVGYLIFAAVWLAEI